ncbi:hypothetical protein L873DRAFT_1792375 [Choiromyces venosus 120613-1]|uniref:Uncharacterized protein n=1 Tax=Choiromyces venosus 120613-1 TaxID=1336337 RepID=A0A3N4JAR9_9PEZI|nr:hypothetical protein L873DRAFT_1813080 [Choiromyces venosus 120613-1]RPA95372.1 hypothetical protein L873DRAFT_1792375 [Choiromyces venosus 120613-1]
MGNICSRGEFIRGIKLEIGQLRNEIARVEREGTKKEDPGRGVEVSVDSRDGPSGAGGGGPQDQTITTTTPTATRNTGRVKGHGRPGSSMAYQAAMEPLAQKRARSVGRS